jgi:hypothetical protein
VKPNRKEPDHYGEAGAESRIISVKPVLESQRDVL